MIKVRDAFFSSSIIDTENVFRPIEIDLGKDFLRKKKSPMQLLLTLHTTFVPKKPLGETKIWQQELFVT